jgi:site-specific recombinase XerD
MTPLRRRLLEELARRNYSPNTVEAYIAGVNRAARHFNRPPDQLTPADLRAFQLDLITRGTSWSQFNQVVSALRFFFRYVLDRPDVVPFVPFGKKPKTLPVVLSPEQVRQLLDAVPPGRARLMFRIAYGCGLRVSELTHLRIADIDSARHLLWVRAGKGNKDRAVPLPETLLGELRDHWRAHRPTDWLFPGRNGHPVHVATLQRACQVARRIAGLSGRVTLHTLRHCYATHLLEAGADLPTLQGLLGHGDISTTMRYIHLRADRLSHVRSPLERLGSSGIAPGHGPTDPGTGAGDPGGRRPRVRRGTNRGPAPGPA